MKVVLLGNAGPGKSTLSRKLIAKQPAARLSLDALAFAEGAKRRPLADSIDDAIRFVESNTHWVVEGCYSDIVEPVLAHADRLVFLNPGVATCVAHCKARPWEPEKFKSSAEQDANLANLITWVCDYESRTDEYGLQRHRALFDGFPGHKVEFTNPADYKA